MNDIYPIKLKTTSLFLDELCNCEYGRYENADEARKNKDKEAILKNDYSLVFCDFAYRWKTSIEIRNKAELNETWYALASGTIGIYKCKTTNRLLDQLRSIAVSEKIEAIIAFPFNSCI